MFCKTMKIRGRQKSICFIDFISIQIMLKLHENYEMQLLQDEKRTHESVPLVV